MSTNQKIAGQFRQGDVLIEYVDSIPASAKRVSKRGLKRITVAHGEATGHHHSIDIDAADWWKAPSGAAKGNDAMQEQFVEIKHETALVHQEHARIDLAPGKTARVIRQREYTPEAIRNVAD